MGIKPHENVVETAASEMMLNGRDDEIERERGLLYWLLTRVSPPTPPAGPAKRLPSAPPAARRPADRTSCRSSPASPHLPRTSFASQQNTTRIEIESTWVALETSHYCERLGRASTSRGETMDRVVTIIYISMYMYLAVHVPSDDADAEHGVRGELAGSLHRNGLYPFVS